MRDELGLLVGLFVLAAASSCDAPTALRPDAGERADGGSATTYYGHVRPILVENCVMCHAPGGIAPFALQEYPQAVEVANRMAEVTRDRVMPPFLADNSGDCQTWSNFRGLTQEEIDTIGRWVAQGTQEGDPMTDVPPPTVLPSLSTVDVTLEMPDDYAIDGSLDDDYRCFVVDPGTTNDVYVTGYDVQPGNAQRVHHVIVYNPVSEGEADEAAALDLAEGDAGDGYRCFGGPRVDAAPLVLWAPGVGATRFPRNTGLLLEAGRRQIIQVHYNNLVEDTPNTDRTRIELSTTASAVQAYFFPLADFDLNLRPRMEEVVESATMSLDRLPVALRVHGIAPHMHQLGRSLRLEVDPGDGVSECMIDVPRWDFNWQHMYWLDRPVTIRPDGTATITCRYDTRERDEVTHWGDSTRDEMCLAFVYVTP